jgi:glycerol-3-phosphate dehydrogenase
MDGPARRRLLGRYGNDAASVLDAAGPGELDAVPGTRTSWAELRWAARAEGIVHLSDLMLRRSRVGLVLPRGGVEVMGDVRTRVQGELGWSDERWLAEEAAYFELWRFAHRMPAPLGAGI